ncbi:MAG TPA: acyl-CoA dehydratase activase-related protein [Myxococcota bacterium]|nr:acyl-CoA dehydratase activase-related protein [Myxococcota bacterium]HQK52350.1 acyl-CoA dehydratase activase-related protein [Myxococcota bacterium]
MGSSLVFLGIDVGAERLKVARLEVDADGRARPGAGVVREHGGRPEPVLREVLEPWVAQGHTGAAATGRLATGLALSRIPQKAAVTAGLQVLHPGLESVGVVSIGAHGFAVIDWRGEDRCRIRENSRCSQGTGNFLRQLVGRFGLTPAEADLLADPVMDPAPLSGRCPVILKTDMTHLANRGEDRARILAGLEDAVCENVASLFPRADPPGALLLVGGVSRSPRIRRYFARLATDLGIQVVPPDEERDPCLEAFGAAFHAWRMGAAPLDLETLFLEEPPESFPRRAAPRLALAQVRRIPETPLPTWDGTRDALLGLDIGSTGSKAAAVDPENGEVLWTHYRQTLGDPVGAAKALVEALWREKGASIRVLGLAVTGSGREIAGSLATVCYGPDRVFVKNEIAAHAAAASFLDPEVDTIFEIGGQDAKYIRLEDGQVVDAAMNEACSAGTGSFIEEQGKALPGCPGVQDLSRKALAADAALDLGQHCSVFMAEVIERALGAGEPLETVVAGLHDSVIQNYLNRVKGPRSVGRRVFCQGMPFASPALAAAVASRTGSEVVVPPRPGLMGAIGIALLARAGGLGQEGAGLDLPALLEAQVTSRTSFRCRSTKGCGEPGNLCRVDRLEVTVAGKHRRFTWGGGCSLYDGGVGTRRLPDGLPDPFREREALLDRLLTHLPAPAGAPVVAMADEFLLKDHAPFFATFLANLGLQVRVARRGNAETLREGIARASVPFCAPLQMFHGMVARMVRDRPDFVLVPILREFPRHSGESHSVTCPMVQGASGILRDLFFRGAETPRLVDPTWDFGRGMADDPSLRQSARELARRLDIPDRRVGPALEAALAAQEAFQRECLRIGERALQAAREAAVPAVVVLGRTYTIYNDVLNSNVPNLLRAQGAMALPVDCLPLGEETPVLPDIYWAHSQRNLRAADRVRDRDDLHAVFCSNYSCGPDSFTLDFFQYEMEHKPYAVIETDGHAGDAGTRTRIEAFLHCVEADQRRTPRDREGRPRQQLLHILRDRHGLEDVRRRGDILLINPMGPAAAATAAALRSEGFRAEVLPTPDRDALDRGRRWTSGKECVPMTITLGSVLKRLDQETDPEQTFALLMPTANGPCRFGAYHILHRIVYERAGHRERIRTVSPSDEDYFAGLSPDFRLRVWAGMVATDVLLAALHDVRPDEAVPGQARAIWKEATEALHRVLERPGRLSLARAVVEVGGDLFGIRPVIREAARRFREARGTPTDRPVIAVVGEIYVRLDPFANDWLVERLEAAGARARLAPFGEWIDYTDWTAWKRLAEGRPAPGDHPVTTRVSTLIQDAISRALWGEMAAALDWHPRPPISAVVRTGGRAVTQDLLGEAILTVGTPLHEYLSGEVDGAIAVGPLECMPNKIAESHLIRIEREVGMPSLALAVHGDPIDPRVLEDFVFQVREARGRRKALRAPAPTLGEVVRDLGQRVLARGLREVARRVPTSGSPSDLHPPSAGDLPGRTTTAPLTASPFRRETAPELGDPDLEQGTPWDRRAAAASSSKPR